MRYNLKNDGELQEAQTFLTNCFMREQTIEMKVVRARRSLKANAYLHLLLQICANEWGYSLAEMKTIYKRNICPNIYVYHRRDNVFMKSSADLDNKEMSDSIEQLKKYSAEHGLILPEPHDEEKINYYEKLIEQNRRYL